MDHRAAMGQAFQANYPTQIAQLPGAPYCQTALTLRVGRVLQDMGAGRHVDDADLLQHAQDCHLLMELAHDRFEQCGIGGDREEAVLWMHRRDLACRALSARASRGG